MGLKISKVKNINYNFFRIFFSIILTFVILTASFFIPGTKNIFANDNSIITICIDPGHGGKDHGTTGPSGLKEKDVNLDIAARLRNKLADAGFNVILTREDDTSKSTDEIANYANSNNADIFVSIHNNSHTLAEKNGTETFYSSQSPASSDFLARCINNKTIEQVGTLNRGVKSAEFKVLKNTKMVSALVEGAFLSNPTEEARLNDAGYRDRIATGIYNGIIEYLNSYRNSILSVKRLGSAQAFVKRVYHRGLNIDPDQATISNWADKLATQAISHADVIRGVIISQQFNNRNLSNEQFVVVLYKTALDRDPDATGASVWLNRLKTQDRKTVLNDFLKSEEFAGLVNHYNRYGYSYAGTIEATTSGNINPVNENAIKLSVLNGTGTSRIAAKTSELFKGLKDSDGKNKYNIIGVGDADSYNYRNTQIICKSNDSKIAEAAEEIKILLKVGIITTQNGTYQDSDIVIIIGKDYSPITVAATATVTTTGTSELILVNILNGEGTQGIAAKVKSKIETDLSKYKDIIKITEAKNAVNFNYKNTKIIIFTTKTGISNIADDLKKLLGVGEISKSTNNVDNVDITIILGSDYKK